MRYLLAFFLLCGTAYAQELTTASTVQDGTIDATPCTVINLPVGIWTQVLFDDAGEPCTTHAGQLQGQCTPNTWNWILDGHLLFDVPPGRKPSRVRVQVWAGGGGGACNGGTADPITCDNPTYKSMKQDETYQTAVGSDTAIPFNVLNYLLPPYFSAPGDGNYQGIWIFAKPLDHPVTCKAMSYHDMGSN